MPRHGWPLLGIAAICLGACSAVTSDAQHPLLPALGRTSESLVKLERDGDWAALLQAHNALWPAVSASLAPLLGVPGAHAPTRRLAQAPPLTGLEQALALLKQYNGKMLQLEALDVEQSVANGLRAALGLPFNETLEQQTRAATEALQGAMGAAALHSLGSTAQLAQAGAQRLAARLAALNATDASQGAWLRSAAQNWQGLTATLMHTLAQAATPPDTGRRLAEAAVPAPAAAPALAPGHSGATERLRQLADRLQALHEEHGHLRERLREVLRSRFGREAGRRLRQAEEGSAAEHMPGVEEALWEGSWLADGAGSADVDGVLIIREEAGPVGGVVAVSQVLLTDVLLLLRDSLDLALGAASSAAPAWAAALGHRPARAATLPLALHLPADAALVLAEGDAADVWPGRRLAGAYGGPQARAGPYGGQPLPAGSYGRRPLQAGVYGAPPLPAGAPPRRALLQDGGDADGEYSEEQYDDLELYDEAYYGEDDYSQDDDWLFDDPAELLLMLVQLEEASQAGTGTAGTVVGPVSGQAPALPTFAVWTGSSRAAVAPSNASGEQVPPGGGSVAAELLVVPFSAAARTPVPREHASGLKLDARYLGAVAAAAFAGLLLLGAVVAWLVRRPAQRGTAAEQEEALLYSHIPGTPAKPNAALGDKWAAKQGRLDAVRASGAIPKKLSNLPA